MHAGIITIGDEILIGQTIDTNSAWIGNKLSEINIQVKQITSISDDKNSIIETLNDFINKFELVLITGGLGPTSDDITKKTLAEYFNSKLIVNESVLDTIKGIVKRRGRALTERIKEQAEVPECANVIPNTKGSAPGMWFERNGRVVVSMPGVPFEMKAMMKKTIIPKLRETYQLENNFIYKNILVQGLSEPQLADNMKEWESSLPQNHKIAYLPSPGLIKLRLSVFGSNSEEIEKESEMQINTLKQILNDSFVGVGINSMEEEIANLFVAKKIKLATAESCTGGNIAKKITSLAGSSEYFMGSAITYSNAAKIKVLNVSKRNIDTYGAVSKEVVEEMALGARGLYMADYAIATSGIAGPGGGTDDKPVGTTWIAIAGKTGVISQKNVFLNDRLVNIESASNTALNMLRKYVLLNE